MLKRTDNITSDRAFQASAAFYIEFYNTKRLHRTLKNLTPCQMEEEFNKNAKWDISVRIAWLFHFLPRFEEVWIWASRIRFGMISLKNAVIPRLLRHKTTLPDLQVSSTCSDWVGSFILVRVVRLERTVSWSQTYWEHFFRLFIAVFGHFLFVLLTLWRSYLRCFRVFRSRMW